MPRAACHGPQSARKLEKAKARKAQKKAEEEDARAEAERAEQRRQDDEKESREREQQEQEQQAAARKEEARAETAREQAPVAQPEGGNRRGKKKGKNASRRNAQEVVESWDDAAGAAAETAKLAAANVSPPTPAAPTHRDEVYEAALAKRCLELQQEAASELKAAEAQSLTENERANQELADMEAKQFLEAQARSLGEIRAREADEADFKRAQDASIADYTAYNLSLKEMADDGEVSALAQAPPGEQAPLGLAAFGDAPSGASAGAAEPFMMMPIGIEPSPDVGMVGEGYQPEFGVPSPAAGAYQPTGVPPPSFEQQQAPISAQAQQLQQQMVQMQQVPIAPWVQHANAAMPQALAQGMSQAMPQSMLQQMPQQAWAQQVGAVPQTQTQQSDPALWPQPQVAAMVQPMSSAPPPLPPQQRAHQSQRSAVLPGQAWKEARRRNPPGTMAIAQQQAAAFAQQHQLQQQVQQQQVQQQVQQQQVQQQAQQQQVQQLANAWAVPPLQPAPAAPGPSPQPPTQQQQQPQPTAPAPEQPPVNVWNQKQKEREEQLVEADPWSALEVRTQHHPPSSAPLDDSAQGIDWPGLDSDDEPDGAAATAPTAAIATAHESIEEEQFQRQLQEALQASIAEQQQPRPRLRSRQASTAGAVASSSSFDAGSSPSPAVRGTTGLANATGEYNCFLNVVVQSLWHLPPFRRQLLEIIVPDDVGTEEGKSSRRGRGGTRGGRKARSGKLRKLDKQHAQLLVSALRSIFIEYDAAANAPSSDRLGGAVSPSALRVALAEVFAGSALFQESQMNDASEVLLELFDALHTAGHSFVDALFGLRLEEHVACHSCAPRPLKTQQHSYIKSMHLVPATALRMYADELKKRGYGERLEMMLHNVDRDQKPCDKDKRGCGQLRDVTRSLVGAAPDALCMVLAWESPRAPKEEIAQVVRLAVAEQLDVNKVFGVFGSGAAPRQLRGVIAYYGEHWVAFVRNAASGQSAPSGDDGGWVTLDDVTVSLLPGGVPELQHKLVEGRLQPAVLLYLREGAQ